jgi:hypothetical protein
MSKKNDLELTWINAIAQIWASLPGNPCHDPGAA